MSDFIEDGLHQRVLRCYLKARSLLPLIVMLCATLLTGCSREVTGQVFIVTKGSENVKLGLVGIYVVSDAQIIAAAKKAITGPGSFHLRLDITQMSQSGKGLDDLPFWEALGSPATKTDADGRFTVRLRGKGWLLAHASRKAGNKDESYTWAVPLEPATKSLLLSNDNMMDGAEDSRRFLTRFARVEELARPRRAHSIQVLTEKRLQWTGAAMRRAGMSEEKVKKALTQGGTMVAWGGNDSGPAKVPAGLTGVVAIAAGYDHTVALRANGTVVSWGNNKEGHNTVPAGLTGVVAIAARGNQIAIHTVALMADGTVAAWGGNFVGQTEVPNGLTGVVTITAGTAHNLALRADGTVVAWGGDYSGQTTVPAGLTGVVAIAAGVHSVALKADGTVVSWGNNKDGRNTVPAGLTGVVAIAAGSFHTVALKADGTVVAWGDSRGGQTTVPAGLTGVVAIAAADDNTVALKADGTVVAWGGRNFYGQSTVPAGLTGVVAIAAGKNHTVALKLD